MEIKPQHTRFGGLSNPIQTTAASMNISKAIFKHKGQNRSTQSSGISTPFQILSTFSSFLPFALWFYLGVLIPGMYCTFSHLHMMFLLSKCHFPISLTFKLYLSFWAPFKFYSFMKTSLAYRWNFSLWIHLVRWSTESSLIIYWILGKVHTARPHCQDL